MGVTKHDFIFDGISSRDRELVVYGGGVDEIAERDMDTVTVPGRNGVLHLDNNRWQEREQKYLVYVKGDSYAQRLASVRTMFGRTRGYKKLEDTFNQDEYAMAAFSGALAPESMAFRTAGLIEVVFACRPERFLKTGANITKATGPVTMMNPTGLPARPLIRVWGSGSGTLTVGNQTITISSINEYVDLDSDLQDAYKGAINCNGNVVIESFPVFDAGTTGISFAGGITSVEITPRWWRL